MNLTIDRDSNEAIYQQIASQIKTRINTGQFPKGTRLPPIRDLASQIGVNRLTVQSAYSELQTDGWVESIVGRGTFVTSEQSMLQRYHTLERELSPGYIIKTLEQDARIRPLRSLASGNPDLSLAPVDEFMGHLMRQRRDASSLLGYATAAGDEQLRVEIANFAGMRDILTQPDKILVTAGATQAIFLAALALTKPGDYVLVHQPLYVGLIHTLQSFGLNLLPVPFDEEGPDMTCVQQLIDTYHPKFFLLVSEFNNPTGHSISLAHRKKLLELAEAHNFYILEDDAYALLAYDDPPAPPMKALDHHERVIYISSFSKIFLPGIRIGYIIAPPDLYECFLANRRAVDASGQTLTERALAGYLRSGRLREHIRRVNTVYRQRRDALMKALDDFMPCGVAWTRPAGGFSSWLTLPDDNLIDVYRASLEADIGFTPGTGFYINRENSRHFRLSFSMQPAGEIREIVRLLSLIIRQHSGEQSH